MSEEIKTRHISVIRNLPVCQLTDEEIIKAARERLQTNAAMLIYFDEESKRLVFLGRYKNKGRAILTELQKAWEDKFGKFRKSTEDE